MGTTYRILAVGGERAVLVGVARAFQAAGATFAAATRPEQLAESAARFQPDLVLVFAQPAPAEASRRVATLRAEPRCGTVPIVLVASLPPRDLRGVNHVLPDPSDVGEFTQRVLKLLASTVPASPAAPAPHDEVEEIVIIEEIKALSSTLLLVDDDPALVKLFSTVMRKSGFEVLAATDGVEGLTAALEHRPDLVVADLNMPRLDGWGLLRAIRADHRVGETPVMFLSSHDDYRESLRALQSGAQDYVAKGGKLDELVARVRKLLAPRDAFLGALSANERVSATLQEVGAQWALRKLAENGATGRLEARDAFWTVRLGLHQGQFVYAAARIGEHVLSGPAALPPLLVLRTGDLLFEPNVPPLATNFEGAVGPWLEQAAAQNNQAETQALDKLLTQAARVEIDPQLYPLYEQLGPVETREIAALVKQGLTPREIIARSSRSPTEVEDTLRDLFRRRVLRLSI